MRQPTAWSAPLTVQCCCSAAHGGGRRVRGGLGGGAGAGRGRVRRVSAPSHYAAGVGRRAAGGRRPAERARGAAAGDGTEVLFDNTTTQLASRCLPRITIDCGASPLLQKLPSCRSPVTFHKEHAYYYVMMLNALLFRLSLTKN